MKRLAVLGAGGHSAVANETAIAAGWTETHFFDDDELLVERSTQIAGTIDSFLSKWDQFDGVLVAIGDIKIRECIQNRVKSAGAKLINCVSPYASVSPSAIVGVGSLILPGAVVAANAIIGEGVIVNHGAVIDHDSLIGDFTNVCPGVAIGGCTVVDSRCWLGIGSSVVNGIKIGADAYVAAGAVVIRDVPANSLVRGVPAKSDSKDFGI